MALFLSANLCGINSSGSEEIKMLSICPATLYIYGIQAFARLDLSQLLKWYRGPYCHQAVSIHSSRLPRYEPHLQNSLFPFFRYTLPRVTAIPTEKNPLV